MAGKTTKGQLTKGVISSVSPFTKDGQHATDNYGNFQHIVKFKGDEIGYRMSTKDQGATTLKVGTEIEYTPSKWESEDGSYIIHMAQVAKKNAPFTGGFKSSVKGVKEYKAEAVLKSIDAASRIISLRNDLTEKNYPDYLQAVLKSAIQEIDKIYA